MTRPTLLAVDGNNLAMRALKASEGHGLTLSADEVATGPLLLFINMISKYVRHVDPDYVVVAFDGGKSHRRLAIFPGYKENRSGGGGRTAIDVQFAVMKQWLTLAGLFHIHRDGYEADDLLGAYWRLCADMNMVILSGDKDMLQLVSQPMGVTQIRPQQGTDIAFETWDEARVTAEFGCPPAHLPILKALMGDTSDCIPGVPGVGPKRALKIANECAWHLLDIRHHPKVEPTGDLVRRNYDLVNLRDILLPDLPRPPLFRPTEPESIAWQSLVAFYDRYELASVKARMFTLLKENTLPTG